VSSAPPNTAADRRTVDIEVCAVCHAKGRYKTAFREDPYEVRRCTECSFVWVSPRYTDDGLAEVYDEGYWQSDSPKTRGYADYASEAPLYLRTFRHRMRHVRRFLPKDRPARVLDVGCAAGFFLRVLREEGHEVFGVEPSVIAGEAIDALGRERVHTGLLEEIVAGQAAFGGPFDLLTMWDVIEHVPDPVRLLEEARHLLRPDGHLLLETQNVDSAFARLLGPRWHHYKHEEHIYHFNRRTVRRVLDRAGFEVTHLTPNYGGKFVSLAFIAERAGRVHPWIGKMLAPIAPRSAAVYVNLRDEMIVAARPRAAVRAGT
jgi:2-polyprenyl-3-methyl-5-hydroxy-6-metoxy-1,4-benzoquinol methylase